MLLYFLITFVVTQVTYYSSCLEDGPVRQTNKCSGLRVGTRVLFTAKIEVHSLLSSVSGSKSNEFVWIRIQAGQNCPQKRGLGLEPSPGA
jgi:hypothetical protein